LHLIIVRGHLKKYYLVVLLVTLLSSACLAQYRQNLDDRILLDLQNHRTPGQTDVLLFLSNTNEIVNIGLPAGLFIGGVIAHDKEMRQNSLYMASSSAVSFLLTFALKHAVKRPRPFMSNLSIVPVYRAREYSFPSGHTSSSFSTATSVALAYPKWYFIAPAFIWAGSVSYSRMYLGVHYPSDVAAGAVLGAGSSFSFRAILKGR
jgi:membrane-associated phospholipid phosphatase